MSSACLRKSRGGGADIPDPTCYAVLLDGIRLLGHSRACELKRPYIEIGREVGIIMHLSVVATGMTITGVSKE